MLCRTRCRRMPGLCRPCPCCRYFRCLRKSRRQCCRFRCCPCRRCLRRRFHRCPCRQFRRRRCRRCLRCRRYLLRLCRRRFLRPGFRRPFRLPHRGSCHRPLSPCRPGLYPPYPCRSGLCLLWEVLPPPTIFSVFFHDIRLQRVGQGQILYRRTERNSLLPYVFGQAFKARDYGIRTLRRSIISSIL